LSSPVRIDDIARALPMPAVQVAALLRLKDSMQRSGLDRDSVF
jgi:hypothetical protein